MFVSESEQRAGMYAVKLDPQFWYDKALERVFEADNEFQVLELPVAYTEDFIKVKKRYRSISLSVNSCDDACVPVFTICRYTQTATSIHKLLLPSAKFMARSRRSLT